MCCMIDNAGPGGAIFCLMLAVVVLQRQKVMRVCTVFQDKRLHVFLQKQTTFATKHSGPRGGLKPGSI